MLGVALNKEALQFMDVGQFQGALASLEEARQVVKQSSETRTYTPESSELWQRGYDKYRQLFR